MSTQKDDKVTKEVALKEVKKWLDFKRCNQKKREEHDDAIEYLADSIVQGILILTKDMIFKHTLIFPVGEEGMIKEISYKPRLKMSEIEAKSGNLKSGNTQALIRSYVCALTDQATGIIKELDTEDNRIAQSIATFFL